ncbi:hypothetical protein CTAYLR_007086 [Chrysophaeum taylorii]|uniref:Coiled-coil domain-containing protein 40 n=1 Tax=Chrysophaeum taylorii TaxID=2483200 RepID=A0AAD7UK98_9STRA|nr:hypothetical protein CTAYLR_007086 [Chrysophaeum taylorii]
MDTPAAPAAEAPVPAAMEEDARVAQEKAVLEAAEGMPNFIVRDQMSVMSVPSTEAPPPPEMRATKSSVVGAAPASATTQDDVGATPQATSYEEAEAAAARELASGVNAVRESRTTQDQAVEEEEEEEKGGGVQLVRDFANHPMMDRVQQALIETLRRELERTDLETREKTHALTMEKRRREDLGVELYGFQQQLAKLQLTLESIHGKAGELEEKRAAEEVKARRAREEHAVLKKALGERLNHVTKNQGELDQITETLRQVEKYNEEMQKEIAITKRATYKAEENVGSLEKAKKDQDLYIDSLEERRKVLGETIAVHEAQLEKQRLASKEAHQMLAETGTEMELIAFEKKQLVQQWKASLVQLARRDEALMAATTSLKSARLEVRDLQIEIDGTRREVLSAAGEHEGLIAACEKHRAEEAALSESVRQLAVECEALGAQYTLLQRSMAHTEEEEAKISAEGKQSGDSIEQLSANIQIVTVERQKIEQKIAAARSAQTTVSKAVKNLQKQSAAVNNVTFEKEIEEANLENELARIRVDALNTEAHNDQLHETLDGMLKKLKDQDTLIARYQQEIRQRNDDIEKKMYRVDRLNRKYEKMTANADPGEHVGPLEATIKNLYKERDGVNAECQSLQAAWLADQTKLVYAAQETQDTLDKNAEISARIRILDEKRLQLLKDSAKRTSQISALQTSNKAMRADVARLNELLGKHAAMEQNLSNDTSVMEMEFQSELRELEAKSLQAEQKVVDARAAKTQLLDDVLDLERQVALWEKKIQLERETQAALDPEAGTSEVKAMEIEIHRMKIRLEGLQREQETMISDMERAISKREAITLRFKGKQRPTQVEHTRASLKKQVAYLRRTIQQTAKDASQLSHDIQTRQRDLQELTAKLASATERYGNLEREAARLQAEINGLLYQKQRRSEMQAARDRTATRYLDLERGIARVVTDADAGAVQGEFANASEQNNKIRSVITGLMSQFDYLMEPLERIMRLADDAIQPVITGVADFALGDD